VHAADAEQACRARGGGAGELVEFSVELVDLEVERADASGEAAQRELARLGWFAQPS
jgi:hypothetical protein